MHEILGAETSDFETGSKRIFYWLFSQFETSNPSPIGSDMFLKYIMLMYIKTLTLDNIGDFKRNIFIGDNQNSYIGNINVNGKEHRPYNGNLSTYYTKRDGTKSMPYLFYIMK